MMKNQAYGYYFIPPEGVAADFIPFYRDGIFRIFYLQDFRNVGEYGEGTPWYRVDTADFLTFENKGEMIPRGSKEEQDLYIFTGSVAEEKGKYHIFYTAHNPYYPKDGRPQELIAHAVSNDLDHWVKLPEDSFGAEEGFDPDNLRDPFVFRDEEAGLWRMACVKRRSGGRYTEGFTAQYVSEDLKSWRPAEDIWAPHLYHTHECPDIFKMGDWYYLIYSEYSNRRLTRYVMSRSLQGPWKAPICDSVDTAALYAAKSWSDGNNRYLFGWIGTRDRQSDDGGWQWGGNLAVTQLIQHPDGTLGFCFPDLAEKGWRRSYDLPTLCVSSENGQRIEKAADSLPDTCRLDMQVIFDASVADFGFRLGEDGEGRGYAFTFIPQEQRVIFERTDYPMDNRSLERSVKLSGKADLRLIRDGDILQLEIGHDTVLTTRAYRLGECSLSLFVRDGKIELSGKRLDRINAVDHT